MSEESHERRREDVAAYAIGALEPDEAAEFERHLAGCEQCRRDLRWLAPAVSSLGESVERREPPASLRTELMATVREEAATAPPGGPARGTPPLRRFPASPGDRLRGGGAAGRGRADRLQRRGRRDGDRHLPLDPGLQRAGHPEADRRLGHPRADRTAPAPLEARSTRRGCSGAVGWSRRRLFAPRRDGTASAAIPRHLDGARQVLVTVEPRGGSMAPTSAPLVGVRVGS